SEFCENAAFVIGEQVLALQGHPEFTPAYTRRLLPRRETCVGSELLQQGLNSLEQPTDAGRVCNWMATRSEEHTSELQSRENLVCRLLLEKKKKHKTVN